MSEEVVDLLQRELDLGDDETYRLRGPLDLGGLWTLHALDRPELKDPVFQRVTQSRLAAAKDGDIDIFAAIRAGDTLLHHPDRKRVVSGKSVSVSVNLGGRRNKQTKNKR